MSRREAASDVERTGGRVAGASGARLLALSGCSAPMIDPADVEEQISTGLAEEVGGAFEASCPEEIPAEAGYTFTCTVTDPADGTIITVTVTEDDADGAFSWRVASVSEG